METASDQGLAVDAEASMPVSNVWILLPFDLKLRVMSLLPRNEVACTARVLCKAAAAHFSTPEHRTIHLGDPVPSDIFAAYWTSPGAMRSLTRDTREKLLCLVVHNGDSDCVSNLAVALEAVGLAELMVSTAYSLAAMGGCLEACKLLWQTPCAMPPNDIAMQFGKVHVCVWLHEQHGVQYTEAVLAAAARLGDLALCQSLRRAGCPCSRAAFRAAAARDHRSVCDWLLENNLVTRTDAAVAAAEEGQPALVNQLLDDAAAASDDGPKVEWWIEVLPAAAAGCDLPTLRALFERAVDSAAGGAPAVFKSVGQRSLSSAAYSRAGEWQAKTEWLLAAMRMHQIPFTWQAESSHLLRRAVALERLTWLRDAGAVTQMQFSFESVNLLMQAVIQDDFANLERLLLGAGAEGSIVDISHWAADFGRWEALLLLHARGSQITARSVADVARRLGQVAPLEALLAALGPAVVLSPEVTRGAVKSGSVELVSWMLERGCQLDIGDCGIFAAAARGGSEEMLEWLVERGCNMGEGRAYEKAAKYGDMRTLRCLRRLRCPWARDTFAVSCDHAPLAVLRWMAEQGFPLDLEIAKRRAAWAGRSTEVLEWLESLAG